MHFKTMALPQNFWLQAIPYNFHNPHRHISLENSLNITTLCQIMMMQVSSVRTLALMIDTPKHIRKIWNTTEETRMYP